jgi:hypothetical protein
VTVRRQHAARTQVASCALLVVPDAVALRQPWAALPGERLNLVEAPFPSPMAAGHFSDRDLDRIAERRRRIGIRRSLDRRRPRRTTGRG